MGQEANTQGLIMDRFTVVEHLSEQFPLSQYWASLYTALSAIERSRYETSFRVVY